MSKTAQRIQSLRFDNKALLAMKSIIRREIGSGSIHIDFAAIQREARATIPRSDYKQHREQERLQRIAMYRANNGGHLPTYREQDAATRLRLQPQENP